MASFRTDGPRGRTEAFATRKYVVWRSLVDDPQRSLLYKYACRQAASGMMDVQDGQVPGTPSAGGDVMMDGLLMDLLPAIESASGLDLFPTYSYFRVYKRGDLLRKHTDRPACEISISLCLGYRAERPWPIWIEGPGGVSRVELEPGDALLYRGVECPHWRDACDGENVAQVFLHYVDQHGPHADWKYDKRPSLRGTIVTRNPPTLASRIRVHDDVLFQESQGEAVLLDLTSGVYFGLDPVGTRIWQLFGAHELLSEIARRVHEEYDVSDDQCASDLLTLVAELDAHGLVSLS